jgi:hypothetical protein
VDSVGRQHWSTFRCEARTNYCVPHCRFARRRLARQARQAVGSEVLARSIRAANYLHRWKTMPSDLSSPRLGERAFKTLDDLNNAGLHKYLLGEGDSFRFTQATNCIRSSISTT